MKRLAFLLIAGAFLLAVAVPGLAAGGSFRTVSGPAARAPLLAAYPSARTFQIAPGPLLHGPTLMPEAGAPAIGRFGPGLLAPDQPVFHFCGPGPQSLVCNVVGVFGPIVRMNMGASGNRRFILPPSLIFRH